MRCAIILAFDGYHFFLLYKKKRFKLLQLLIDWEEGPNWLILKNEKLNLKINLSNWFDNWRKCQGTKIIFNLKDIKIV